MADSVTDVAQKQAVTKLNLKMRASHMDECNDEKHSSASSVTTTGKDSSQRKRNWNNQLSLRILRIYRRPPPFPCLPL